MANLELYLRTCCILEIHSHSKTVTEGELYQLPKAYISNLSRLDAKSRPPEYPLVIRI